MQLCLWRHGHAEREAPSGLDEDRALTPAGEQDVRSCANEIKNQLKEGALILSSPYLRARQTAAIIRSLLPRSPELQILTELASGASPQSLLGLVRRGFAERSALILVGHLPDLTILACHILGRKAEEKAHLAPGQVLGITLQSLEPPYRASLDFSCAPR